MTRVYVDTSVLVRYFADDDPARAFAAATLVDGDDTLVVSTASLIELVHVLRTEYRVANPELANGLATFLARENVELADADRDGTIAALRWSARASARRIPDALIGAAAERARCAWIATFDQEMTTRTVPVRSL